MIINIEEELKKYKENKELQREENLYLNKNFEALENIEKKIKYIYGTNQKFYDEFKEVTEKNLNYKDIEILNLKREVFILKEKEKKIINGLIKILDAIDWFNKMGKIFINGSIGNTIFNTNRLIKKELITMGITTIENLGEFFDENIHCCVDVREDKSKENNEIVEVIRKGYSYKDNLLRAAEVVVVKNKGV